MGHKESLAVFGSMPITSRGPWTSLDMSQSMNRFLCEPARICPSVSCPVLKTVNQGKIQPGGDKYLGHPGHVHSWQGGEGRGEGWHLLMNWSWKQPFRDTGTGWMLQISYYWPKTFTLRFKGWLLSLVTAVLGLKGVLKSPHRLSLRRNSLQLVSYVSVVPIELLNLEASAPAVIWFYAMCLMLPYC